MIPLTSSLEVRLQLPPRDARAGRQDPRRRPFDYLVAVAYASLVIALLAIAFGGQAWGAPGPSSVSPTTLPTTLRATALVDGGHARSIVRARSAPFTAVRPQAPQLRSHVAASGETLFSIAARYGVTPQTIAFNNGLDDTADVQPGRSLVVPPLDAAIHVVRAGETLEGIAAAFGVDVAPVRTLNAIASDVEDVVAGKLLLLPVADSRYPGFRLRVAEAPRVFAPRVGWPTEGVITQLFSGYHTGVDIAAPYGAPIVASDGGTVTTVGPRGPGGLHVCVHHDWGLETCAYHAAAVHVEVGERVVAGQLIASVGVTGVSSGPHVHWEARTNGALVDPLSYAPFGQHAVQVGGPTGAP